MNIIHLPGCHFPLFPRLWPSRSVSATFSFTESCRYALDNGDQGDWNKLCGLKYSWPWQPLKAVMFGWRYNPETKLIEIAAYINDPVKGRMMGEPMASFRIGATVKVRIRRLEDCWLFGVYKWEDWIEETHPVSFDNELGRPVAGWFGGNRAAPHTIVIER
jgi:hypothetical protein